MRVEKITRKWQGVRDCSDEPARKLIAFEIVERRIDGESPVKVWREYRGMTQERLAEASKVSRPMIAAIEAGTKKGAIGTLKRLAAALQVDLETLLKRSVPERSRPHRLQ